MLQYLLNSTAIWLISLIVFQVFLHRESYHGFNRFYLLCTFIAGLLLPLWHWEHSSHIVYTALMPAQQAVGAGQVSSDAWGLQQWLTAAYLCGAVTALSLLIIDIAKLVRYYLQGRRYLHNEWLIVETHKEHSPFSFLHILFVSSRQLYDRQEWDMLLIHERQHATLLHFADLLLMQLARVAFWFHPLVYKYHSRLMLVHEYQADGAALQPAQIYGRFLIEQAMLQPAPSVAHALSRSPVKKRIMMLTHRSPAGRHLAKMLVLPLIALFMFCFTRYDIEYQIAQNNTSYTTATAHHHTLAGSHYIYASGNGAIPAVYIDTRSIDRKMYRPLHKTDAPQYTELTKLYPSVKGNVILLAGMENNPGSGCCSATQLWGSNYGYALPAGYATAYAAAAAVNPCTKGFDLYRKEQYTNALETYRHVQESWSETMDGSSTLATDLLSVAGQFTISDDPWAAAVSTNGPGTVHTLSIDRKVFGPDVRSIFDNAVTLPGTGSTVRYEAPGGHDWHTLAPPAAEPGTLTAKTKAGKYVTATP